MSLAPRSGADARRLCIVARRRPGASETFITAHVERLPADVTFLHANGGDLPRFGYDGAALFAPPRASDAAHEAAALARFLTRGRFDAVLAEYGTNAVRVHAACALAGVPLVVHFHGYDVYKRGRVEPLRRAYGEMLAMAAAVIAVSGDMAERLRALGAPPERIFRCPCGVDLERFAGGDPTTAAPLFVGVGRFVEKKGQELTLRAFARARATVPEARMVLAGSGERLEACRELARELGIADAVEIPGALAPGGVAALLRRARAFVQHSHRAADGDGEGTPVAILEAAASALPVIATRHGGIPEAVVDGRGGLLVDEGDLDAMSAAIVRLAREPRLAARLGREARAHVAVRYDQGASIARLWSVIEGAIQRPRSVAPRATSSPE